MNAKSDSANTDAKRYRIGIGDFIAWTTCAAIAIFANRWMFHAKSRPESWLESNETKFLILFAYQAIFIGAQLASFYVLARSRRTGSPFPQAPGHFILIFAGVIFVANVVQFGMVRMFDPAMDVDADHWLLFFYSGSFAHLISACLAISAVFVLRNLRIWQMYFLFNAIELFLLFLFAYCPFLATKWPEQFSSLATALNFVPGFLWYAIWIRFSWTIICLLVDRISKRNWNILHYVGIISIWAITFGNMAFNRFW